MNLLISTLLSSAIFGIIDSIFYLIGENDVQIIFLKVPYIDMKIAEILSGGISSALAMFVSLYVAKHLENQYKFKYNPLLHSIGILLGCFVVILFYLIYRGIKNHMKEKHIKKRVRFSDDV